MNNIFHNFSGHPQIFSRDFTVRYSEVNKFGIIKLHSVFDYLQQTAAEHANKLNCGMHALYDRGMLWVLSKMSIKFNGAFHPEQKISVYTYPSRIEKLFFRREFEICDAASGGILLRASSFWLLLNAEKLRPLRRDALGDISIENPELPVFIPDFPPFPAVNEQFEEILTTRADFSRMDINQHMNNAQYANMTEDALFEKLQSGFSVNELHVAFLQAQKYPDMISTLIKLDKYGEFYICGTNKDKNCAAFNVSGKLTLV